MKQEDSKEMLQRNQNLELLKEIMPAGGMKHFETYTRTGTGYEACVHIWDFPNALNDYWMSKLCNYENTIVTIDLKTEDHIEVKKNLNKSIQEQSSRKDHAQNFAEYYDAENRESEMQRMYDEIDSMGEVIKSTQIRIFVAEKTLARVEDSVERIISKLAQTSIDVSLDGFPPFITEEMVIGALKCQEEYGYPASVTVAQIIAESGYGSYGPGGESGNGLSKLAYNYKNLFGIKGTGPSGSVNMSTGEQTTSGSSYTITAGFRVYKSYTQCIEDRAGILTRVYATQIEGFTNADDFATRIAQKWATDISYATRLSVLMETYNLHYLDSLTIASYNKSNDTGNSGGSSAGISAANYAKSKVGCAYNQGNRFGVGVYDCSSLVWRAYAETGTALLGCETTAALEGKWGTERQKAILQNELQPGDWIFYGNSGNGRYRGIYHVAIYYGNGMMVEAANPSQGVIFTKFRVSNINLYVRPTK